MRTLCAPDNVACLISNVGDNIPTLTGAILWAVIMAAALAYLVSNAQQR